MAGQNFLFVSIDGLITDIAWRVAREGHNVRYFIETEYAKDVGNGFVNKSENWRDDVEWADIILFDDTWGGGEEAKKLRSEGIPVVGGTPFTDRLEEDRQLANETMRDLDMDVIESESFQSLQAGIEYIQKHPKPYVFKPSGVSQNYKELLYVGQQRDGRDVIHIMQQYQEKWEEKLDRFQLQRRVNGIEISVCGFFNGERFLEPVNYTFEHKPFFPGGIGPMTGEMGTSMFWTEPTRLFEETVRNFQPLLKEENYHGPFDINCIVTRNKIYPLEFTPRFGYPQIAIQEEGIKTSTSELLYDIATGGDPDLDVHDGFQVGARVCVPPFPYDDVKAFDELSRNAPVWFDTSGESPVPERVHLEDVKYVDGEVQVAGETGEILVITGRGESMKEAQEEMYDLTDRIIAPNMYYRNDIGDRWYEEGDKLLSWGYI